jgi:acylphosphatase
MMTEKEQQRLHASISGRVQGVGFRAFTASSADRLGLTGWVRNRFDGTVETVAEGERGALEDFLRQLRNGPGPAYVDNVEIQWLQATGEFNRFGIRTSG